MNCACIHLPGTLKSFLLAREVSRHATDRNHEAERGRRHRQAHGTGKAHRCREDLASRCKRTGNSVAQENRDAGQLPKTGSASRTGIQGRPQGAAFRSRKVTGIRTSTTLFCASSRRAGKQTRARKRWICRERGWPSCLVRVPRRFWSLVFLEYLEGCSYSRSTQKYMNLHMCIENSINLSLEGESG